MNHRILIVGGGVVGLSLAWELAQRGQSVTLVERDKVGKATSWAAAGILPPANLAKATDPIDQLRGLSHQLFPQWARRLESITGIDPGFRRCGGWYLADTPGERASMVGMTGYWDGLDIRCEPVDPQEVARREPAIARWIGRQTDAGRPAAAAWWVPDEHQVRAPHYLQALAKACQQCGVTFVEDSTVDDLRSSDQSSAARCNGQWLEADAIVVCGGSWTGRVAEMLQLQQSIVPIRGQIVLLKTDKPRLSSIVNVGHRYVMCRDDGSTLIGSCEEEVGFQPGTDEATLDMLRSFAIDLVPELESATFVKAWSGYRPLTFDGFPMIGKVPDHPNLYVASGHFRSGLHLSPGTAVALADVITQQKPAIDLSTFRVGKQQSHTPQR
ncbi:Hydrogen cyanide synthase subunit HcnC precursor [Rubripirellula lacrimiformis]|uniref:Hydrogen cyanide synthase subunit HcnC n=1 Tax=Rubripirellula lacrimiformis TaxID=1930273 RepID=A0A517N6A9_9BACT|nr:glycine oxidase ThiO [Rubripirellula lacrimiformis]QDT02674.1 Hydrogen cyanide synthase subunit HcnC precursor [Rubripirellula lacrimiformis]